jgi:hypothetical protein
MLNVRQNWSAGKKLVGWQKLACWEKTRRSALKSLLGRNRWGF